MSYLFLTTRGQSAPLMRAAYSTSGPSGETVIGTASELPRATAQHIVLTIDSTNDELGLYLNGTRQTTVIFSGELSAIVDVNNWLGRSQFASDYEFMGTYDEFRIYDVALTQNQVRTSSMAGPNAPFLP